MEHTRNAFVFPETFLHSGFQKAMLQILSLMRMYTFIVYYHTYDMFGKKWKYGVLHMTHDYPSFYVYGAI